MDHALSPHACTEAPRRDDERDCEVGTPDKGAGRAAAAEEAAEVAVAVAVAGWSEVVEEPTGLACRVPPSGKVATAVERRNERGARGRGARRPHGGGGGGGGGEGEEGGDGRWWRWR
jgi:uncharacterized membrane protein YgcG